MQGYGYQTVNAARYDLFITTESTLQTPASYSGRSQGHRSNGRTFLFLDEGSYDDEEGYVGHE